ncbi:MAG TPA: hypothetical protein VF210_12205 [Pseudomonadales bacterium]
MARTKSPLSRDQVANIARIEFAHRLNRVRDIARIEAAMVEAAPDLDRLAS